MEALERVVGTPAARGGNVILKDCPTRVKPFYKSRHDYEKRLAGHVEQLSKRVNASVELRAGPPVEAIARFARESDADFIVVSTLGRTGLRRALIGGAAERVVRHAPCLVLAVRERAW